MHEHRWHLFILFKLWQSSAQNQCLVAYTKFNYLVCSVATVSAQWKRLSIGSEPPPARAYHSMSVVGPRYLLIGGFDGKTTYGDPWWLVPQGIHCSIVVYKSIAFVVKYSFFNCRYFHWKAVQIRVINFFCLAMSYFLEYCFWVEWKEYSILWTFYFLVL